MPLVLCIMFTGLFYLLIHLSVRKRTPISETVLQLGPLWETVRSSRLTGTQFLHFYIFQVFTTNIFRKTRTDSGLWYVVCPKEWDLESYWLRVDARLSLFLQKLTFLYLTATEISSRWVPLTYRYSQSFII